MIVLDIAELSSAFSLALQRRVLIITVIRELLVGAFFSWSYFLKIWELSTSYTSAPTLRSLKSKYNLLVKNPVALGRISDSNSHRRYRVRLCHLLTDGLSAKLPFNHGFTAHA